MSKRCIIPALILGLILFLGDVSQIFAQETSTEEFTLEEITVTAQKREENLQKVPIAMEVISGETMKELGYDNVDEMLAYIGNVVINKAEDGYRVAIRGVTDDFGVFNGLTTSTPTVAISTDGIYSSRNDQGSGLYDVERTEVLFGPQSTMYANTSPGGIVNVVTAAPKTDKYEVSGSIEYGNYSLLRTEGAMNAPLSDKMALRAAFSTSTRDGYISNGADDEDTKSARLKALFQATEKLSFILTGQTSRQGGHGFASVNAFADQDDVDDPWVSDDELGDPSNRTQNSVNGNMTWDTGIGTVTLVPSYSVTSSSQVRSMTFPGPTEATVSHMEFEQTEKAVEARMTSPDDFLFKWIAGFNYYKSDNHSFSTTEGSKATAYNGYWNDSKALYANITYPVTDNFRVTAGGRKNWADNTTHGERLNQPAGGAGGMMPPPMAISANSGSLVPAQGPPGGGPPAQPGTSVTTTNPDGTTNTITDYKQEYPNTDYKFGVEYDLGANSMLYADVSTSYRFQGQGMANAKGEFPPPEEMTAYTLGAKNRFLGNKLQVNVSAYWYEYKNKFASGNPTWFIYMWEDDPRLVEQGYTFVDNDGVTQNGMDLNGDGELNNAANPGTRGMSSLVSEGDRANWGDYRSRGIDIQTSWMITNRDKVDISYSYMDNVWTDLYYTYTYTWIYPDVDYSGKSNTNSPKHNIIVTYSRNFPLWNGGTLTTRLDTRYQTEFFVAFKEITSPYRDQEAYHISNLSLIYANPDGKWTLTGYVKNIENYAVKRSLFDAGENPEEQRMNYLLMIGPPRTYGVVLSVNF